MRRTRAAMPAGIASAVLAATAAQAAPDFAPKGATAKLTVEYRFEAQGRKQDKIDLHEWKLLRSVELVAELEAAPPQPMPTMHALEAAQTAKLGRQQAQAQKAAGQMAPMMASAEAIMAKCGDDEACLQREAMAMGTALAGTPQLEDAKRAGKDTAAVMQPDANRYQFWTGRTQQGRYTVDETWHVRHGDPICMRLPGARCTHDLARKGSGELATSKASGMAEVDLQGGTLMLTLPIPLAPLDVTETQTTDEPEGTHETPTPRGPQPAKLVYRMAADGSPTQASLKVALKGGWRSQAGEQVVEMGAGPWHGAPGTGGQLRVRWRFDAR